jgi:hypothetical protein
MGDERLPEELEALAARLRASRAQADPLELDQIKRRVMARHSAGPPRLMRSKLATVATLLALVGGTGGVAAIASSGGGNGPNGGAASGQYRPGKGCGDRNHIHPADNGCPPQSHH